MPLQQTIGAPGFPSPADFPDSPLSQALKQPVLLGLFLPIQAGGWTDSTLPRSTDWRFDYNRDLVLEAERQGFDLVFALSQWLPKGGYSEVLNGQALDSFMATAALTSITKRILLISTIHVLYGPWHPLHLAKFGATLDHISGGRWGINVVTGHRAVEHEMFGWTRIEHDRRYELADEFLDALQSLWTAEDNSSISGARWTMKDAFVTPKPAFGRPILVNATGSEAGIALAARHSDIVFITSPGGADIASALETLPAHTARVKAAARAQGREIRTLLNPLIIARDTEAEARAQADAILAHHSSNGPMGSGKFDSDAQAWAAPKRQTDPYAKVGGNIYLIGTPEQIVERFVQLRAAGVDGFQLSFFDFAPDLAYFGEKILPLMRAAGLRLS
ncbi:LLM class flavin-dependent oxidoreductase [Paenirhodobacter populi]|uniref:LLM class flavin-dependent oxidoreductase n=1 Tax=Paenirhodobacter populi TaxID=2306993 RepID=UPI000FE43FD1|nr:LLM class flavin-dependent oxidoreductase [Sinirhodobacter populi]RWR04582.1 LLM class flavin-dependent oxidoreductase [Sinirhodobacter populi]